MKEIDKIRIRQWNQDNPYIQMKNLENAQPGYRVHTVNDASELNWVFHIQASSPAIRTQADGYPGISIIGRQELNEYRKKSCARR